MQLVVYTVLWAAVLFTAAGRLDWLRAWVYLGLYVGGLMVTLAVVLRTNPEVIAARAKRHADTKHFDKVFVALYTPLVFLLPLVAGLDAVRFRWSSLPFATLYVGAALYVLGTVPAAWAMAVNPYLEQTVRIQTDRGHVVIASGPYRIVRHPLYVGVIVANIASPLLLGSLWAYVPAAMTVLLFIWRTALEDRTLRHELPGYAEYAQRTRHRLFPGVW
jgi:protein-S-isoprenylcysteine O-methyltransferase Ste14